MHRFLAATLIATTLSACDAPTPTAPMSPTEVALARTGDPPPPPEDADVLGFFGATESFGVAALSEGEPPTIDPGPLEFSLDGRYFLSGGGMNGWLRLSSASGTVITFSDPRVTFRDGSTATGSGIVKVVFDHGYLIIDLATDVVGATFSNVCAAGGDPCAVIDIAGADFWGLEGGFAEVDGTLVVVAEIEAP